LNQSFSSLEGYRIMAKQAPPKQRAAQTVKPVEVMEIEASPSSNGAAAKVTGAKNRQATAIRETEVLQSVSGLNMDAVSGTIASTQVEVQKSLAALSAKLVEQLQVLGNVEEAIALKREELKQLYDIESAAVSLDDLDAKIQAQRESWMEEQSRKQREFAEQQAERSKLWARTEEEYEYRVSQENKKREDEFAYRLAQQEKANREKQEQLEKNWSERDAELKKREKELEELRAQVANIPEQIRKAENAAAAVAGNSVKKEYETKMLLATKDAETAAKLAEQEVASLRAALEKATGQLGELKEQLDRARDDVKEISSKALESASGRSAMEALQKVLEKDPATYKSGK
jgi:colicin import membrane protein